MKTFEEKWTAWIDDELTGRELEEFEASLPDKAAAEAEKQSAKQLGLLLREQAAATALTNADFFSHQLRERLERENQPAVGNVAKDELLVRSPLSGVGSSERKRDRKSVV